MGASSAWTKPTFAYCETVGATPWSPNHIRKVTTGLKTGGGADTPALCGRDLHGGWDIRFVTGDDDPIGDSETVINGRVLVCPKCAQQLIDIEGV